MLIAAIVFGPFLMAFVSYGIGRRQENARDIFVILVTFLELLLSLLLVRGEHSLQITGHPQRRPLAAESGTAYSLQPCDLPDVGRYDPVRQGVFRP